MKIWSWQNRANLHLCMTEKILSWMIIQALIVHHIVWLQLMIWTWKNRANFHLCITENILSRMTIPALIIHHVVLAATPSKKRTKLIINVERMNAFVIFVLLAFFFLCTGIDVWEAKDWKHCFPNIWRHIKLTTRIRLISAVNFFLFPKENPKVYCSVCYGKIYWLFCVVAWNIFIRKLFTFKHFQFIRVHPSSFIPVGQNI